MQKGICSFYLLVVPPVDGELTVGNNYGLGKVRKGELLGACKTLGIGREERCVVLDHPYSRLKM
jgi:hypothetical protein